MSESCYFEYSRTYFKTKFAMKVALETGSIISDQNISSGIRKKDLGLNPGPPFYWPKISQAPSVKCW